MRYGCLRWDSPGRRHRTAIAVHITVICATKGLMDVSDMASRVDRASNASQRMRRMCTLWTSPNIAKYVTVPDPP